MTLGDADTRALIARLRDECQAADVRATGALVLGKIGGQDAIEVLTKYLGHRFPMIRVGCAKALRRTEGAEGVCKEFLDIQCDDCGEKFPISGPGPVTCPKPDCGICFMVDQDGRNKEMVTLKEYASDRGRRLVTLNDLKPFLDNYNMWLPSWYEGNDMYRSAHEDDV